jgi:hypothetical protein
MRVTNGRERWIVSQALTLPPSLKTRLKRGGVLKVFPDRYWGGVQVIAHRPLCAAASKITEVEPFSERISRAFNQKIGGPCADVENLEMKLNIKRKNYSEIPPNYVFTYFRQSRS